jgi:type IV secretory pathway TrbD component
VPRRRASCANCGSLVPKGARFCPECGTRHGGEGATTVVAEPADAEPAPVTFSQSEPRLFGVTPPMAVFALGIAAAAVAVLLLVAERWLAGGLTLAAAVLLLAAFAEVARRKPSGPVARASAGALGRVRARADYLVDAYATRSRARRELARVRRELVDLNEERERVLRRLGEAVYRGDRKGTKRLGDDLGELDAKVERKESEMATIATEARERLERARLQVQPTEMVEVPEPPQPPSPTPTPGPPIPAPDPGPPTPAPVPEPGPTPVPEPYPPPDEVTPPQPARIPEPGPLDERRGEK